MTAEQTEDLLQVMRDYGWSETGPSWDPVRWLRDRLADDELALTELRFEIDNHECKESAQ